MKIIHVFAIIFILSLFSSNVIGQNNQLNKAISHAEQAIKTSEGKEIAAHAEKAKTSALKAKEAGNFSDDAKYHLEAGIISLEHAIEKGNAGALDSAHQDASDAVKHFKEISN